MSWSRDYCTSHWVMRKCEKENKKFFRIFEVFFRIYVFQFHNSYCDISVLRNSITDKNIVLIANRSSTACLCPGLRSGRVGLAKIQTRRQVLPAGLFRPLWLSRGVYHGCARRVYDVNVGSCELCNFERSLLSKLCCSSLVGKLLAEYRHVFVFCPSAAAVAQ